MKLLWGCRIAVLFCILRSFAVAQMALSAMEPAVGKISLPPKNPTISAVTPLWKGVWQQEGEDPSGSVTEARQEFVGPEGAVPYPARGTTILKFDPDGHEVERTSQTSRGMDTTTRVFQGGKLLSMTTEYHRNDGKVSNGPEWRKWSYDANGRVSDVRIGTKDKEHKSLPEFQV